jgi:hypothetical protein
VAGHHDPETRERAWPRNISPSMKKLGVLIDHCCRLRSAVAIRGGEIKGANAVRAKGARECRATVHLFYCVIPHTVILFRDSVRAVYRLITIVYERLTLRAR